MQSFELPEAPKIRQQKPVDRRMYSVIPIRVAADRRLRPAAMRVLLAFCSYANRAGLCWPSNANVGKDLGVTPQAVSRQLIKLIDMGYIRKIKNSTWGRTAQILRIVYDDSLSDKQLMHSIDFDDKPPSYQQKELRKAIEAAGNAAGQATPSTVEVTAERVVRDELSVEDCVRLWKVSCQSANISRVITSEDLASLQQLQAAGVSFGAFEAAVRRVFDDWRQYRREPPHRLSYFLRLASTD